VDLQFTPEQLVVQETVRSFVEREAPSDMIGVWFREPGTTPRRLLQKAAEAGWMGMLLPHEVGGSSAEVRDCAVVFEQLGRGPVPGPFFASGVLGPLLVWETGSEEQRDRLIPPLCNGEVTCTVALSDDPRHWDLAALTLTAEVDGDDFVLNGQKRFVHDAPGTTWLLCAASSVQGPILAVVESDREGVEVRAHKGFLASLSEVEFRTVRVPKDNVLTGSREVGAAVDSALERALPILAAFQVGGSQRVFEMTVAYTSERVVFGQPIGRFQRVQDHCVELVNHLDAARWITYETLWKLDGGVSSKAAVHETKAVASEAYYQVCTAAHKVFAGHGTALDHPLVPHTLMSRTLYQYLGDPTYHKERMMDAIVSSM
jgi:alkylation response protein AidB-like acyl-CoA dehydrogenase